ncbi:hypothetical protein K445DRAFT_24472 [Daldinia sp. EC12]|nr:hypothetical protein K445DRAFT_24472 [Daldinia sp. EC12]
MSRVKDFRRKLVRNLHDVPTPESYAHGLFILHPPPELSADQEKFSVDIVAVHGLNGKARETWRDEQSNALWLEDFLPDAIPNAQIMTFGYDSSLLFSNSKGRIEDFARDLLNRLWVMRQGQRTANRPIVFIAHSLGGIVVKKALILAHENEHHFGDILSSTTGIVFMGTPHQGSMLVDWTSFLRNLIHITSGTQLIRTDLVQELSTHSPTLLEISKSFLPRSIRLNIMSFIELQIERPLATLVVPVESARLNLPNERVFPVNNHHRNICRYASKNDQTYALVEGSLQDIVLRRSDASTSTLCDLFPAIENPGHTSPTPGITEGYEHVDRLSKYSASPLASKHPTFNISNKNEQPSRNEQPEERPIMLTDTIQKRKEFKIHISGLQKLRLKSEREHSEDSIVLNVPGDMSVYGLKYHLANELGTTTLELENFRFPGQPWPISNEWVDFFTIPVQVTNSRPCYKESTGYKINTEQSIAAFLSRAFPNPLSAKLRQYPQQMQPNTGMSHSVTIGRNNSPGLHVCLMRTIRIKGDEDYYTPPTGLGTFSLFDTLSYKDKLPTDIADKGGLFFPMHEREAMWMSFDCDKFSEFAVRPFVGGVNGITGDNILSYSSDSDGSINKACQDYITIPSQKRLDGVASRPGVVKQFVATKLSIAERHQELGTSTSSTSNSSCSGSGTQEIDSTADKSRTIEWQMTGKDEIGGIQLHIIPKFETERMFAGSTKNVCPIYIGGSLASNQPVPTSSKVYDVLKSPSELGLPNGDTIHVKILQEDAPGRGRYKLIQDLIEESPQPPQDQHNIKVEVVRRTTTPIRHEPDYCMRHEPPYYKISENPLIVVFSGVEVFCGLQISAAGLKARLFDKLGILPHCQIFQRDGIEVSDEFITSYSPYDERLTLELVVRPQPTLGIGAGGNIIQDICPDNSDPRLWDVASSKILHIQIINSERLGSIIGPAAAPERPIDSAVDRKRKREDSHGVFDGLISVDAPDEIGTSYEGMEQGGGNTTTTVAPITLLQTDQTIPKFKGQY